LCALRSFGQSFPWQGASRWFLSFFFPSTKRLGLVFPSFLLQFLPRLLPFGQSLFPPPGLWQHPFQFRSKFPLAPPPSRREALRSPLLEVYFFSLREGALPPAKDPFRQTPCSTFRDEPLPRRSQFSAAGESSSYSRETPPPPPVQTDRDTVFTERPQSEALHPPP